MSKTQFKMKKCDFEQDDSPVKGNSASELKKNLDDSFKNI